MKQKFHGLLRDKLNIFYILAFLPLLPMEYYRYAFFSNPQGILIPLYGFFLLLLKKDKLSEGAAATNAVQRALGVFIVVGSFFQYYIIVLFIPWVGFYGVTNYLVYLSGLLFIFFRISALKETFNVFFLIAASGLAGLSFKWIETQIAPIVPHYVYLFSFVLGLFGIKNTPNPTSIMMYAPRGVLLVGFEAGCIGVYSLIIFSIIIVVAMFEASGDRRTKLLWSAIGLIGVFVVNIIRLLIVFASIYLHGWDFGQTVHQVIGYVLFLSWVAVFLLLFSGRQIISDKIQLVLRKVRGWL